MDPDELAIALSTDAFELRHYLDLEIGQILAIMEEMDWRLEEIYAEIYDEGWGIHLASLGRCKGGARPSVY